jgi:uncharacterized protein (TIGR02001 family)
MKKTILAVSALVALGSLPSAAWADLAFNVGAVTDYRYRGISQTRLKPAIQGGIDYSNGGLYLGTWASNIKWIKDAGGDDSVELDLYGGYKGEITKGLGYDVGLLTYQYPGNKLAVSANTTEIYGALSYSVATLKVSHSVSNLFGFDNSKSSDYVDLSASFDLGSGFSLVPHVGYQKVANNGDFSYTDYSLTLGKDFGNGFSLSAALIGAHTKDVGGTYSYISPDGKNLGKAALVVGAKYTF